MLSNAPVRKACLVASLLGALLSAAGCSSGSSAKCLNPQPLPPFCGDGPEPHPTTGGLPTTDETNGNDAGAAASGAARKSEDAGARDAGQCRWPDSLDDAGPGACSVGRAYIQCTYPSGAGCACLSDDPTGCPGCGPASGAVCTSVCSAGEYAVSCGGPPLVLADGGAGFDYQSAPSGCRAAGGTPGGNEYSCCPCAP